MKIQTSRRLSIELTPHRLRAPICGGPALINRCKPLVVACALALVGVGSAQAAGTIIFKANNTTDLNTSGSEVTTSGGTTAATPLSTSTGTNNTTPEILEYDSTVTAANTTRPGGSGSTGSIALDGFIIANPGGAITINTAGTNTITLGASGIDMSNATQDFTINNGTLRLGPGSNAAVAETWTVAAGRTLTVNAGLNTSQGGTSTLTIAGTGNVAITGTVSQTGVGRITVSGATVTLSGASNTTTGALTLTAGTLNVGNGGTGGFLGTGAVANSATLNFNHSDALAVGVAISGTGTVSQLGTGTLSLTTTNTYSGVTTISAGTLLANAATATGTGPVSVVGPGRLGGTGSVNGTVTVASGATLLGGDGATTTGVLTLTANPTLNGGSTIELTLGAGGAHSTLALTAGNFNGFNANQAFTLDNLQNGIYDNIITGVAAGINTSGWTITNANGTVYTFTDDGSNIDLNVGNVPEPGTCAFVFAGLVGLASMARRRRQRA